MVALFDLFEFDSHHHNVYCHDLINISISQCVVSCGLDRTFMSFITPTDSLDRKDLLTTTSTKPTRQSNRRKKGDTTEDEEFQLAVMQSLESRPSIDLLSEHRVQLPYVTTVYYRCNLLMSLLSHREHSSVLMKRARNFQLTVVVVTNHPLPKATKNKRMKTEHFTTTVAVQSHEHIRGISFLRTIYPKFPM